VTPQRRRIRLKDRLRGLLWQLRGVLRPTRVEREIDDEHAFHIEMEADRLLREGVPPDEARRRARVAFGGVERHRQAVREARWTWGIEEAWRDSRYAFRALAQGPLFSLSAVGTLAVGIGAATTFFSAVQGVLLRPLPVAEPDRLLGVELVRESGTPTRSVSLPDYLDYRDGTAGTLDLAAHHLSDVTLSNEGGAIAGLGLDVSSSYFRVLGVTPALGRFFAPGEADRVDAPAEVVLSHDLWEGRFGRDPSVVGGTLTVNGQALTVVGVAPAGFRGTMLGARPAVFLPLGLYGRLQGRDIGDRMGNEWLQLFGRLTAGTAPERAAGALGATARALLASHDYDGLGNTDARVSRFSPLPAGQRQMAGRSVLLLLASASVLLLVAAVNVAGMMLARASRREREISLRLALGAGRARLARQLLTEGLVLGLVAGGAGIGLTALGMRLVEGVRPPGLPGFGLDLPMDGPVLAFAVGAALLASLVFGLVPAYHATRADVGGSIKRGATNPSGTPGRSALVGAQVALTLVLLVSTALLLRTLEQALATDHGFDQEGLVLAEINLRLNGYDNDTGPLFYRSLLDGLRASPEIASAALSTTIPLGPGWDQTRASVPGLEPPEPSGWVVGWSAVSDGYFETLGFRFRSGGEPDRMARPPSIVVNDALAELFWSDDRPVGRTFRFNGQDAAVSGVVPTGKYRSFSEEPTLYAWFPLEFAYTPSLYVHVRPTRDPATAVAALRQTVASLDPHVPLINVTPLETAMAQSLFFQRTAAGFIGAFAAMALLLSATGIFGLLAYTVEQRRREIGIRMALGAPGAGVVGSVVRKGLAPVLVGLVVGAGGALLVGRLLEGLLYGVPPGDPRSFGAAGAFLLGVALVAAWVPAARAARVDPAATLNTE
jgi:predicted permease